MRVLWTQGIKHKVGGVSIFLSHFQPVFRPRYLVSFILLSVYSAISWLSAPFSDSSPVFPYSFYFTFTETMLLFSQSLLLGITFTPLFPMTSRPLWFHLFHKEAQTLFTLLLMKDGFYTYQYHKSSKFITSSSSFNSCSWWGLKEHHCKQLFPARQQTSNWTLYAVLKIFVCLFISTFFFSFGLYSYHYIKTTFLHWNLHRDFSFLSVFLFSCQRVVSFNEPLRNDYHLPTGRGLSTSLAHSLFRVSHDITGQRLRIPKRVFSLWTFLS